MKKLTPLTIIKSEDSEILLSKKLKWNEISLQLN